MGLLPVARRRAAKKPAIDVIVQFAPSHRVERHLDEVCQRVVFGLAIDVESQLERGDQRKLGRGAETAMLGVEGRRIPSRRYRRPRVRRQRATRHARAGAANSADRDLNAAATRSSTEGMRSTVT